MAIEIKEIDTSRKVVFRHHPKLSAHDLLARARSLGAPEGYSYAGGVTPREAWALFSSGIAELVDVRTLRELDQIGHVPGTKHVEWLKGPEMLQNPRFIDELTGKVGKNDVVLFLCRSGKRSVAAAEAAAKAGFRHAFNVREGFEGDGNPQCGWLRQGLPSTED